MLDRALSANKYAAIAAMPVCRSAPITEHIDSYSVVERLREWSDWQLCWSYGHAANMFKWKPYFDTTTPPQSRITHRSPENYSCKLVFVRLAQFWVEAEVISVLFANCPIPRHCYELGQNFNHFTAFNVTLK